ncbi:hypothetical protein Ddc_24270 [Ditylenchus destructor]|nr:hypothetical protein Ddc_24270 [Ditylenchus destructor]
MSQSPYLLTCCCYGDGCNGNQADTKYKVVQEEQIPELKCYQGITSMDQPVNSTGGAELLPCFEEGHYSSEPVCVTMLKSQPHFEKCCCNGDGCNGDQEPIPINGLKCYQRQTMMDQPVNSTGGSPLLPCQISSIFSKNMDNK